MTYTDLIRIVTAQTKCTQSLVKQIVESMCDLIAEEVKKGDVVRIPCLGSFARSERPERIGRNPSNGEPMMLPARVSVKFRVGKALQDKLEK